MSVSQPGQDFSSKERTDDVKIKENVEFKDLFLSPKVLSGLQKARFERPSPIQLKAIPYGRCGLDLIIQAKSGTGKTCVFTVISLESLSVEAKCLQVIILAPTREIAVQIEEVIEAVGQDMPGLGVASFIGGRPLTDDKENAKNCHIAVGSPGRIFQLIEMEILRCENVKILVLDEADKLLEESFQSQINAIYSMLPTNKQMIAASATYPKELAEFVTVYMRDPTFVRLNPTDMALLGIRQHYVVVDTGSNKYSSFEDKIQAALDLLSRYSFQQVLIFSNYHSHAKDIADACNNAGFPATYISGSMEQSRRLEAIRMLKDFKCRVLISTDLTSRGIDASNVDLVLNMDVPGDWETYMHRSGRAGRYGSRGAVISVLCAGEEEKELREIAELCKVNITLWNDEERSIHGHVSNSVRQETKHLKSKNQNNTSMMPKKAVSNKIPPTNDCNSEATHSFPKESAISDAKTEVSFPTIPSLRELMSLNSPRKYSLNCYTFSSLLDSLEYYKNHGSLKKLEGKDEEVRCKVKVDDQNQHNGIAESETCVRTDDDILQQSLTANANILNTAKDITCTPPIIISPSLAKVNFEDNLSKDFEGLKQFNDEKIHDPVLLPPGAKQKKKLKDGSCLNLGSSSKAKTRHTRKKDKPAMYGSHCRIPAQNDVKMLLPKFTTDHGKHFSSYYKYQECKHYQYMWWQYWYYWQAFHRSHM